MVGRQRPKEIELHGLSRDAQYVCAKNNNKENTLRFLLRLAFPISVLPLDISGQKWLKKSKFGEDRSGCGGNIPKRQGRVRKRLEGADHD